MKCVMCNYDGGSTGIVVFGIERNYRICKKCLMYHRDEFEVVHSKEQTEKQKTTQIRKYIQEKVDEKLNHYLLEE